MARHIAADGLELFRAVVVTTSTREGEEPTTRTSYFGPYNKVGTARAQVTAEKRSAEYLNANSRAHERRRESSPNPALWSNWKPTFREVTGHVEKANVTWEQIQ